MKYLLIFVIFYSNTFSNSNKFSKDILDSLSQKVSKNIAYNLFKTKNTFKINSDINPIYKQYFQSKITNELSNLENYEVIDTSIISIYICNIILEVIPEIDDIVLRNTKIEISSNSIKNNSINSIYNSQLTDTIKVKDVDYLNQTLPFQKPILPNSQNDWGSFKKLTEAILISASAAVAVVLFFSVRSK